MISEAHLSRQFKKETKQNLKAVTNTLGQKELCFQAGGEYSIGKAMDFFQLHHFVMNEPPQSTEHGSQQQHWSPPPKPTPCMSQESHCRKGIGSVLPHWLPGRWTPTKGEKRIFQVKLFTCSFKGLPQADLLQSYCV